MFDPPPPQFSYLKLFAVVVVAVAVGNLLSNWITARVAEANLQTAAAEAARQLRAQGEAARQQSEAARLQMQANDQAAREQLRQTRAADQVGIKLDQACAEWRKANGELNSYTTRTEQQKACSRLEQYLDTGSYQQ